MTALLTLLRIKGFAKAEALAELIGRDVSEDLKTLSASGEASETRIGWKLTPEGQARADAATADERAQTPDAEWDGIYDDFHQLNGPFKAAIAGWQMRDGAPNDHADAEYDAGITDRIADIHAGLDPVLDRMASASPRLAAYRPRFEAAMAAIRAGEARMVAAPIIDSYHTVWFELHEDLIRLSGRTRAAEAAAGRAV